MTASAAGGRPPSVDRLARHLSAGGLPAPLCVNAAREAIAAAAEAGDAGSAWDRAEELELRERRRLLQPVINATGVLLHTNLGRAPLAVGHPAGYTNLELDLDTGRRGDRDAHAGRLLAHACGAGAAHVVNNGAAAVLLALTAVAAGRDVIVSRGELIEIGGGFRIPEVLAASGARLVEVGTTNRTRRRDVAEAVTPATAAILKVHTSNYRITGFTSSVTVSELADVADRAGSEPRPVVLVDVGSGLLDAACPWLEGGRPPWLGDEPAVRQTLAAGADLVTFSGDKLLGGPQAGVIAGRADLVARCRNHPLTRAVRPGGLVLDVLQRVALSYLARDAGRTLPLWRMATCPVEALRDRAAAIGHGEVVACSSVMGGGTLPGRVIPSAGLALAGDRTAALRSAPVPVLARVVGGRTICDLRSVLPEQDEALAKALTA